MNERLGNLLQRVEHWPEPALDELECVALEIEAEQGPAYHAGPEELEAIDEALAQVDRGDIATPEEVDAAFARLRRG